MTASILLPAIAATLAILALALSLRWIASEAGALKDSLRRMGAAAVASEELTRLLSNVGDHAIRTHGAAHGLRQRRRRRTTPPL